ncbi:MAG: kynureninase [Pseudomonadota bacterium]|nr:kynureninase [Pseudomonadota bacterium]MEC7558770.1 kynureninase [Pseudomonadota bacterium]MEC8129407.1 kynureninase [Pseudomonadota bacterium]
MTASPDHRQSLESALARDAEDRLAPHRDAFALPDGVIYLDGNSLGALPRNVAARVASTLEREWGHGLIRSWNEAGWIDLPARVGARIAPLIGADPACVVAADSTTVNLFKTVSAALALRPDRRRIVTETRNFPTDNYIAEGVIRQCGGRHELVHAADADAVIDCLDADTAVLMLSHVNYRDGAVHDMAGLTRVAHEAGALVIWDLAHSAGVLPLDLAGCDVDFAVGCGYKFLNGGPGAPAFLYAAERHHGGFAQPLSGWFGHADPFGFDPHYRPAGDITQYLCGTPPVISMVALEAALELWDKVDLRDVHAKSQGLTDFFIELVEVRCAGHGLTLVSPRDAARRSAQVSLSHPTAGYAIISALIADGVIGDFRAPNILRFGFAPLYTRFADVWHAVDRLAAILDGRLWDRPEFHARRTVT